jgi:ABC-type transport system involved in cytochrome bd biosynthesis fused ATPase/permease subunit
METVKKTVPFNGTKEQEEQLLAVIAELKSQPGCLMPIMQKAQDIYGYLPIEVQTIIADELGIPLEKIDRERVAKCLEIAQALPFAAALPQGLDTLLSPNAQNFSAGERQRLALARMKLEDKPIVILDEALKNLDNITAHQLLEKILEFCQDRSLLFITHDLRHPAQMDKVLEMELGKVVSYL